MEQRIFKICPMCGKVWGCRDSFLDDPELYYNGYQPDFGIIEQGLFYFTHLGDQCGSTMGLPADTFLSLYQGPRYRQNKQLSAECSRKCLDREELTRCQAQCKFAFVREVSQLILDRAKRAWPAQADRSSRVHRTAP